MNITNLKNTFIIAEAGVNHNGNLDEAHKLIDIAYACKADAVKFQTFKTEEISSKYVENVDYIKDSVSQSNIEMLNSLALSYDQFRILKEYADKKGIIFLSTPDGLDSLNFLVDDLKLEIIKIGSTEITNIKFLEQVGLKNKICILSTGLSNLNEVEKAYSVLKKSCNNEIIVLQCTSDYPAKDDEVNIRAMLTIQNKIKCEVGFSDHSLGFEASIAAVSLGAKVIEKHITSDKNMIGPDHKASMDKDEFYNFVKSIRKTEKILGNGIKTATNSELKNISGIRRGIVAARKIKKNTIIQAQDLYFKRPFLGINPDENSKMLGKKIKVDLEIDQPIVWQYFES